MQTIREWPSIARRYAEESATGCLNWLRSRNPKGYGFVRIDGHWGPAHRVAYRYYHGPIPEGAHILHDCDNPSCVNPLHLRAGTNAENIAEKVQKCRAGKKLQRVDVEMIKDGLRAGIKQSVLAEMFGIDQSGVSKISSGLRWTQVP